MHTTSTANPVVRAIDRLADRLEGIPTLIEPHSILPVQQEDVKAHAGESALAGVRFA